MVENPKEFKTPEMEMLCRRYAADLWAGIEHLSQTPTKFPVDRLILKPNETVGELNDRTSPTNIGLFLVSLIAAKDLGLISSHKAEQMVREVLSNLAAIPTFEGLYFNWYDTDTGELYEEFPPFISTVDNAWLAGSLMIVQSAIPNLFMEAEKLLVDMDFSSLFDDKINLYYGGIDPTKNSPSVWHYGVLNTEARIAGYVGSLQYGLSEKYFATAGRSLVDENCDREQTGDTKFYSWNGSVFEAMMPSIFVPEVRWSSLWEKNLNEYLLEHINFGFENLNGYWGISPCDDPDGNYISAGLVHLGLSKRRDLHTDIVSPHAIFQGLVNYPEIVLATLQRLETSFPVYRTGFGFSDSVDIKNGKVSSSFLSLDQEISMIALSNYLANNNIQDYFSLPVENRLRNIFSNYFSY